MTPLELRERLGQTRIPVSPEFAVSYFSLKDRRVILKRLHRQLDDCIREWRPRADPLLPRTWALIAELDAQLGLDMRTARPGE